jgi:uncharacterized protein (DUF934 family)
MQLLKHGEIFEDPWVEVGEEGEIPSDASVLVPFARLAREDASLRERTTRLGVVFPNDRPAEDLVPYVADLGLVVLTFPALTDGRAFSQARQIRRQLKFTGELRARGNFLLDQVAFMRQCGIDAFETNGRFGVELWLRAATAMSLTYQRHYLPERGFAPAEIAAERRAAAASWLEQPHAG